MAETFTRFPLLFDLSGKNILFIGGGKVAERKLLTIINFSPNVTLVAPAVTEKINELAQKKQINMIISGFRKNMLTSKYSFVFIATDDYELNKRIMSMCKSLKIPVNVADNPECSDFHIPAVITDYQSEILLSVSTNGKNPSKSKKIKEKLIKFIKNGGFDKI